MNGITLHLMRHGAPEQPGLLWGHEDVASSAAGIAACVAKAQGLDFAAVVTSDLSRASVPGAAIAAERGVAHRVDPRWRELDFGDWDGADPAMLPGEAMARFWDDPDAFPPPGGERWSDLRARVRAALEAVEEDALVLSHGGAMRAALAVLGGLDARQAWIVDLPYGALLRLRVWRDGGLGGGQIVGLT